MMMPRRGAVACRRRADPTPVPVDGEIINRIGEVPGPARPGQARSSLEATQRDATRRSLRWLAWPTVTLPFGRDPGLGVIECFITFKLKASTVPWVHRWIALQGQVRLLPDPRILLNKIFAHELITGIVMVQILKLFAPSVSKTKLHHMYSKSLNKHKSSLDSVQEDKIRVTNEMRHLIFCLQIYTRRDIFSCPSICYKLLRI